MTVLLPPAIQKLIDDRIRDRKYRSVEDVLTAALISLEQQEDLLELSPAEFKAIFPNLREQIAQGMQDVRSGKLSDGDAFFDELDREDIERQSGRKTA